MLLLSITIASILTTFVQSIDVALCKSMLYKCPAALTKDRIANGEDPSAVTGCSSDGFENIKRCKMNDDAPASVKPGQYLCCLIDGTYDTCVYEDDSAAGVWAGQAKTTDVCATLTQYGYAQPIEAVGATTTTITTTTPDTTPNAPATTSAGPTFDDFAVYALPCQNAVFSLNNLKIVNYPRDTTSLQATGVGMPKSSGLVEANFYGTTNALTRAWSSCGKDSVGYYGWAATWSSNTAFFHTGCNHGGIFLGKSNICGWSSSGLSSGESMAVYFGFDANKQEICDGTGTGGYISTNAGQWPSSFDEVTTETYPGGTSRSIGWKKVMGCSGLLGSEVWEYPVSDKGASIAPNVITFKIIPSNLSPPTTTAGTRDCSILAIDEFLLQCSTEFPSAQQQVIDLGTQLTTLETNLQTQVTTNAADIMQLQTDVNSGSAGVTTQIQQLQTDLLDVNARIDLFAAKSPGNFNIDGGKNLVDNGVSVTDVIIIGALMTNFMVMIYIYCLKQNGSKKKHVYVAPYDVEADAEQVHLK